MAAIWNWISLCARELFDSNKLREDRIDVVWREFQNGDQSGMHLKETLRRVGLGMSSVRFYAMMSQENWVRLYYDPEEELMPFARCPMFRKVGYH